MNPRIAIVSAGAVGGYVGAHFARAGLEPILIDGWPEHVEHVRAHGISLTGTTPEESFNARMRILHVTDAQELSREAPIDIAFICAKSYDTEWSAMLIRQYLAPGGFCVSLQNAMNDERLAGVVGTGRTLGCIASKIMVDLHKPGHIHRGVAKGGKDYTIFRVGEFHGRITPRAQQVADLVGLADSSKVTTNLWGERWSKLVANCMENGVSACTGLTGNQVLKNDTIRHFQLRVAAEAIRTGQALGYSLEAVAGMDAEQVALAGEGDPAARGVIEEKMFAAGKRRSDTQVASMGQDMRKGRRTEIAFLNGHVVEQARTIGREVPANRALVDLVTRVEKGQLAADARNITDLRLA